jgi:DNA mismatch endonuclease, patch repair protein
LIALAGKDKFTQAERSAIMAAIRSQDTAPERVVRLALHRLGYRYRLHDPRLPGKPDLSFPSRRVAIFVHGCFWHRHRDCRKGAAMPVARQEYWMGKFGRTVTRDAANQVLLEKTGWTVVVIWECQLRGADWLVPVQGVLDAARLRPTNKLRVKVDRAL